MVDRVFGDDLSLGVAFLSGWIDDRLGMRIAYNDTMLVLPTLLPYMRIKVLNGLIDRFHLWAKQLSCDYVYWTTATGEWDVIQRMIEKRNGKQIGISMSVRL